MGTASPLAIPPFEQEVETYERHKQELLATARGKHVVILGSDIIGVFDTDAEATTEAYKRLGRGPFLVREITDEDPIYTIGGSLFGLTNVDGHAQWMEETATLLETNFDNPRTGAEIIAQWTADGVLGAWANRDDIVDSQTYARSLRQQVERPDWKP